MSFLKHGQIYRPMGSSLLAGGEAIFCYAPATDRLDESAAGYSLAGCSPAESASASPAGSKCKGCPCTYSEGPWAPSFAVDSVRQRQGHPPRLTYRFPSLHWAGRP